MRVLARWALLTLGACWGAAPAQAQPRLHVHLPGPPLPAPPVVVGPAPPIVVGPAPPMVVQDSYVPQPPAQSLTMIQMRSNDPGATLWRMVGEGHRMVRGYRGVWYSHYENWESVCRMPCGVAAPSDGLYGIRGLRINWSRPFVLPGGPVAMLDVDAGHTGVRSGGVVMTTFGGIALVLGTIFTPISFAVGNGSGGPAPGMLGGGLAMLGLGSALMTGGIAMLVASKTRVHTSDGYQLTRRPTGPRLAYGGSALQF